MILPAAIAHRAIRGDVTHLRTIARTELAPWSAGQSIPIRTAARQPTIGRLIVIAATRQTIGDITHAELRQEGWGGRNPMLAFARDWLHRHDRGYRPALPHATDEEILHRLRDRHAHQATWRIEVTPDPRQPCRLLAARSELGYTSSPHLALPDEPEAVDEATQEAITRAAHQRDQERRHMTASLTRTRLRNDITDLQQRLMAARLTARRRGIGKTTDEALRIAHAQLRRAVDSLDEQEATNQDHHARRAPGIPDSTCHNFDKEVSL